MRVNYADEMCHLERDDFVARHLLRFASMAGCGRLGTLMIPGARFAHGRLAEVSAINQFQSNTLSLWGNFGVASALIATGTRRQ